MKKGFSLLEVLIGTFIASLLSTVLLYVLSQTTGLQRAVDTRIDVWTAAGIVENQLEKDVMGMFAPFAAFSKSKEGKEKEIGQATLSDKIEKEQKKLEHALYVTRNNLGVQNFSFITTNMLPKYQYARQCIGRVVYSLIPDKDDARIFSLLRQEGNLLELDEYTKADSSFAKIELANNIAAMNVRFVIIKQKEDGSGVDFQTFDAWPIPKTEEKKDEQVEEMLVPDFIQIKLTFWRDVAREKKETVTWYVSVVAVSEPFEKKEPENKKENDSKKGIQQRQPMKNNSQAGGMKKQAQGPARTTNMNKYGFPVKMVHN